MPMVRSDEEFEVMHRIPTCRLVLTAFALLSTSCAKEAPPPAAPSSAVNAANAPLIVSAATSTKEVVEAITDEFAKANGVDVKVNAGPSNALASQILAGAPADLFLSANAKWADEIQKGGLAAESIQLLTNHLVIVVPKGNPAQVREPKDLLSDRMKKLALAGEQVPAGMYADQALTKLELMRQLVEKNKIVRGQDVRSALGFVERGEAEAGIVYSTDVSVVPDIESVYTFDAALHDDIVYVLVLTKPGATKGPAKALFDFFASPNADATYVKFSFERLR
jgi:molybdate transport system substrate-binding protein